MSRNKNKEIASAKRKKLHIRKNDEVIVIAGDDKGTRGRVLVVDAKKNRAIVEGIKIISRHTKPNAEYPNGGIIKKEASVHLSNLMLVDPKSGNPTRVGRKKDDGGKSVRFAKKSGEII